MKQLIPLLVLLVFALTACQEPQWYDSFPHDDSEIFSSDVLGNQVPADQMSVFGVSLNDTPEDIISVHGEPDILEEYGFGLIKNFQYSFEGNQTQVLYHVRTGTVKGILVTSAADQYLHGLTRMNRSQYDLYPMLGQPSLIDREAGLRRIIWDDLGYEVYVRRGSIQQIYFTAPHQHPDAVEPECESDEPVDAVNDVTGECLPFPNNCIVPDDWDIVSSCDAVAGKQPSSGQNSPPTLCIQVVTPAVGPDGECVEYGTPCDVPEGWQVVESCGGSQ